MFSVRCFTSPPSSILAFSAPPIFGTAFPCPPCYSPQMNCRTLADVLPSPPLGERDRVRGRFTPCYGKFACTVITTIALFFCAALHAQTYDTLIRNGRVTDGS